MVLATESEIEADEGQGKVSLEKQTSQSSLVMALQSLK